MNNRQPTDTVLQVGQMNFEGNIIPHTWYHHLKRKSGKTYLVAIIILAEIVYWYRPRIIMDEVTGQIIRWERRFKADLLQKSYKALATKFGLTDRQVRDAVKYLDDFGVITRVFRTITTRTGTRLANVLFIDLHPEKLREITYPDEVTGGGYPEKTGHPSRKNGIPIPEKRDTSLEKTEDLSRETGRPVTEERETCTKNTTENTTKNTTQTTTTPSDGLPVNGNVAVVVSDEEAMQALLSINFQPASMAGRYVKKYNNETILAWVEVTRWPESDWMDNPAGYIRKRLDAGDLPPLRPESSADDPSSVETEARVEDHDSEPVLMYCPGCDELSEACEFCGQCPACCVCEAMVDGTGLTVRAVWRTALDELKLQMSRGTFSWLKPTRVVAYEPGIFVIGVDSVYAQDWLDNRLRPTVERTLAGVVGNEVGVQFITAARDGQ